MNIKHKTVNCNALNAFKGGFMANSTGLMDRFTMPVIYNYIKVTFCGVSNVWFLNINT